MTSLLINDQELLSVGERGINPIGLSHFLPNQKGESYGSSEVYESISDPETWSETADLRLTGTKGRYLNVTKSKTGLTSGRACVPGREFGAVGNRTLVSIILTD